MKHTICYWDSDAQEQRERESTPEEDAQREIDIAAAIAGNTRDFQYQKNEYLTEVRKMRADIFARLNGYGVELMLGEPPVFVDERALLSVIFNGLRDITTIAPVLAATDIASLKNAVKAEYARLVGLASPGMKTAFAGADK